MSIENLALTLFLILLAIIVAYCIARAASIGHYKTKLEYLRQTLKLTRMESTDDEG